MRTVLVFGTFDVVHNGHVSLFKQALEFGDRLVVVVARDLTVEKVKGRLPKFNEQLRRDTVQSLDMVSSAVLGSEGDKYLVIKEANPDVICLGYDQEVFVDKLEEKLKEFGLEPKIVRLEPFEPKKYKSGLLREQASTPLLLD